MEGFLTYITPKRKYSAVIYDEDTQANLRDFCEYHGFNLDVDFDGNPLTEPFEFHTTIFMGRDARYIVNQEMVWIGEVYPTSFELLGPDLDIPVILIDGSAIQNVRKFFERELGEKDLTYPVFKPHISLSYSRDFVRGIKNLPLPDFPLKFDKVVIRDAT